MEYNVRTNIANVYIGLDDYEDAAAMLLECERILDSNLKEASFLQVRMVEDM